MSSLGWKRFVFRCRGEAIGDSTPDKVWGDGRRTVGPLAYKY